ncbi:HAD family hydrolase [Carboxydochorda subterranea]|uniref:HAD family hydrolase n=1 Tax=Carboxydichorda subterranea TaxID=3109565 RepID=A0ABZ1BVW7_9FIRM|nr:HAD family hydrolase [Limnochorda sp. L945t]WRP16655.1 HAD family hydrolase [Limnochorda sp. L945t]
MPSQQSVSGPVEAIIFDIGDTLLGFPVASWDEVDRASIDALRSAMEQSPQRAGAIGAARDGLPPDETLLALYREVVEALNRAALPELKEVPARRVLEQMLRRLGITAGDAELDRLERAWAAPRLTIRRLYPEVPRVLAGLRRHGVRLGVISNIWLSGGIVREHLDSLGLMEPFEAVVLSSEVGYVKPHPVLFSMALEQMGVKPAASWYVGDNPHADVAGAKAVGMRAALVKRPPQLRFHPSPPPDDRPYTGPSPDLVLSDLTGLLSLVEGSRPLSERAPGVPHAG